ncbi:MAG TPA: flavin reductase family protein [Candidatus Omnitrophota bacterium]|nr:flavin reductase family protein [Candidatus Omnitrophota bacterium]
MIEVPLNLATRLINHGPVVLVSSRSGERKGVTPVAWTMPLEKDPPLIALVISESHFIYRCITETGDFVVNIPSSGMAGAVMACGNISGHDEDKFSVAGLSERMSRKVLSPGVAGSMAFLECELVRDRHLLEEYNVVAGRVKYAEAEESAFRGHWLFEKDELLTLHHLGNGLFCRPETKLMDLRGT